MRYLVTILGVIIFMPLVMFKKAFDSNIRYHEIEVLNYNSHQPFRLFFISDIHRRSIPDRLIEKVGKLDAVILGGDLAEKGVPLSRIEENVKKLAKIGQIYYVWGNNDREVGERNIRKYIKAVDGILLENEAVCIECQNTRLWIAGIDDVSSGRADIVKSFENVPENETIIFVSHTPFVFNKVKNGFKPDVLLAGHTHGGQIRWGKWGYYQKGSLQRDRGMVSLISNGFGTTFVPFRFGAPAESHVLTLAKTKSKTGRY